MVLCALLIGLLPGPLFAQYNHEWYKTQVPPYRITAICRLLESQNRATCMIAAVFGAERKSRSVLRRPAKSCFSVCVGPHLTPEVMTGLAVNPTRNEDRAVNLEKEESYGHP